MNDVNEFFEAFFTLLKKDNFLRESNIFGKETYTKNESV